MTYLRQGDSEFLGALAVGPNVGSSVGEFGGRDLGGRIVIAGQVTRRGAPLKRAVINLLELRDAGGHRVRMYQPGRVVRLGWWLDRRLPGTRRPSTESRKGGFYALHSQFDATTVDLKTAVVRITGPGRTDCLIKVRLSPRSLPRDLKEAWDVLRASPAVRKRLKTKLKWVLKAARPSPEQVRWGALLSVDLGNASVTTCQPAAGCRVLSVGGGAGCRKPGGLGGYGEARPCAGWESDRESFSKVVAEHYVRTELGRNLRGSPNWCSPSGKICRVDFPANIRVGVSFVKVPHYVIARQTGRGTVRREYTYRCTSDGRVILRRRR